MASDDEEWHLQHKMYDLLLCNNNNSNVEAKDVFKFFDNNFESFQKSSNNLTMLIKILNKIIQQQNLNDEKIDIGIYMLKILEKHEKNEDELHFVLKMFQQLLKTVDEPEIRVVNIHQQLLDKVVQILWQDQNGSLNANLLIILKLYTSKFKNPEFLEILWLAVNKAIDKQPTIFPEFAVQIIVQLYDQFADSIEFFEENENLLAIIRKLITSKLGSERKPGQYLLKKYYAYILQKGDKIMIPFFRNFITLLENLEESQSHLILPSLEKLSEMNNSQFDCWTDIIYKHMLEHKNVLVNRWALEYILSTFTCSKLAPIILVQFLLASNSTNLYNLENYCLPNERMSIFLNCDPVLFIKMLVLINWKTVPLHYWLKQMTIVWHQVDDIPTDLFLNFATIIRKQRNTLLRMDSRNYFMELFHEPLYEMNICEYILFVEHMYNIKDRLNITLLKEKLANCKNYNKKMKVSKRFYEILTGSMVPVEYQELQPVLLKCLQNVPMQQHGWFRYLIVFELMGPDVNQFCRTKYDIDIDALSKSSLKKIMLMFKKSLAVEKDEESFVRQKSVDFFLMHRSNLKIEELIKPKATCPYTIDELLDMGSFKTLLRITEVLKDCEDEIPLDVLDTLINAIAEYERQKIRVKVCIFNMLYYLKKQSVVIAMRYSEALLKINLENLYICGLVLNNRIPMSKHIYMEGLLLGETPTGDERIEKIYESRNCEKQAASINIRHCYLKNLPQEYKNHVFLAELLQRNNEISKNRWIYYENSKEHRLKLRIASALLFLALYDMEITFWCDSLWDVLLKQNNQLNIVYMYELLIGVCAPTIDVIMEHLKCFKDYQAAQQVSIICVTHNFLLLNLSKISIKILSIVINTLLPLTMGLYYNVRVYAQVVIYKILLECASRNITLPDMGRMTDAILAALGNQMDELTGDIRLKSLYFFLHYTNVDLPIHQIILYCTNAPYDECSLIETGRAEIEETRKNYLKKHVKNNMHIESNKVDLNAIQRKMNPINGIIVPNTLEDETNEQMYVVASLVEKLPNLGGLARTCDVIGIKNFVVSSLRHLENNEFKNLSMTAEHNLNISEVLISDLYDFLVKKRLEGFKIIGAEQTDASESLVDFKFPKKCILLLGHEKEGIPANLLSLLDHAIEIPQFGVVRSLNVHVTGAMFMWEYCKQHINKY